MKFENVSVFNIEGALRGMRNPKNSWHLSDSVYGLYPKEEADLKVNEVLNLYTEAGKEEPWLRGNAYIHSSAGIYEIAAIGPKDMDLAQRLIAGGSEHRKFLRQIQVCVDITAPLYLWKEFDTYKVGTVANSTSTMHKLTSKPITLDCFEIGDYSEINDGNMGPQAIIDYCEFLRQKYLETQDKAYWKELVRWLPEGWLQTRTVTLNYENLAAIYHQRKNHKLVEWSGRDNVSFINFIYSLPYSKELICYAEDNRNG